MLALRSYQYWSFGHWPRMLDREFEAIRAPYIGDNPHEHEKAFEDGGRAIGLALTPLAVLGVYHNQKRYLGLLQRFASLLRKIGKRTKSEGLAAE
eukprot:748510-Rhodomonas_salina.1